MPMRPRAGPSGSSPPILDTAPVSNAGPPTPLPQMWTDSRGRAGATGAIRSVAAVAGSTSPSSTARSRPGTSDKMRAGTAPPPSVSRSARVP